MKVKEIRKSEIVLGLIVPIMLLLSGFTQKPGLKEDWLNNGPENSSIATSNLVSYNYQNNQDQSMFDSNYQNDFYESGKQSEDQRGVFDSDAFGSGNLNQEVQPMQAQATCCDPTLCIPDPSCEGEPSEDIPLDGGWEMILFTLGIGLGLYKLLKLKISIS